MLNKQYFNHFPVGLQAGKGATTARVVFMFAEADLPQEVLSLQPDEMYPAKFHSTRRDIRNTVRGGFLGELVRFLHSLVKKTRKTARTFTRKFSGGFNQMAQALRKAGVR